MPKPNHVTNKLTILGTEVQIYEVLDFIKIERSSSSDERHGMGTIDFNKITPMPPWVYGSQPNVRGISLQDTEKYGEENTSLEWARKNWGSKWGAYGQPDTRNTENTIYFETTWNGVPDLIHKIAWMFPGVTIEYSYADEDFGQNVAEYHFKDTEVLKEYHPIGGSTEAYTLASNITQHVPDWFNPTSNSLEAKHDGED